MQKITERVAMARHAVSDFITWGAWENGQPTATAMDVAVKATAMYGQYLRAPLTDTEAETGLLLALKQKGLPAT